MISPSISGQGGLYERGSFFTQLIQSVVSANYDWFLYIAVRCRRCSTRSRARGRGRRRSQHSGDSSRKVARQVYKISLAGTEECSYDGVTGGYFLETKAIIKGNTFHLAKARNTDGLKKTMNVVLIM